MIRTLAVALAVAACASERGLPDAGRSQGVHPPGIDDPASDDFHGRELERLGHDLAICARCHGDDFAGGAAGVSCVQCHPAGPDACATCHREGGLGASGAHPIHATASQPCAACHVTPARWDDEGHVRREGGIDPRPAELAFGALANTTLDAADRAGPPTFADGRCANVYCHGDALHAGGGRDTRPAWTSDIRGGCDGCHGAPPPSHASGDCMTCHPAGALHLDGVVELGTGVGCSGCHGDAQSPAPPRDLGGNIATTAFGVGAHRAHLEAWSRTSDPIACATCHVVPASLTAVGHLDSPRPAEVVASLGWDRARGTCATAWCHGPARPVWIEQGGAACGSCHGVPPATPPHDPSMSLARCADCHPSPSGPGSTTAEHIDGDLDLR